MEYSYTGFYESTPAQHSELASLWGGCSNFTFRYNLFTFTAINDETTGGLMFDSLPIPAASSLFVYGNIFAPVNGGSMGGNNGQIGSWCSGGSFLNHARVFYNTFISNGNPALGNVTNSGSDNIAQNNLFYLSNPGTGVSACGGPSPGQIWNTVTHNHFVSSSAVGTNTSTGTGNPFVNWPAMDFRLTQAAAQTMPAGLDIGSGPTGHTYNVDMFGNPRTSRTRGAIEFITGGPPPVRPLHGGTRRFGRR
jgi:hypothetical protein